MLCESQADESKIEAFMRSKLTAIFWDEAMVALMVYLGSVVSTDGRLPFHNAYHEHKVCGGGAYLLSAKTRDQGFRQVRADCS